MKQLHNFKVKNKFYKSEKSWLIPLAAASVIAGVTVTSPINTNIIHAATSESSTEATSSTPTAKTITKMPTLANFYISVNQKYVPYNAKGAALVLPYATNHMATGDSLYGFYIVLPKSITGNLEEFQQSADNYVAAIKNDYTNPVDKNYPGQGILLNSLKVYQLNNTSDDRQVFYFRPDDDAKVGTPDPDPLADGGTTTPMRIRMSLPIQTGADIASTPASITVNAGVPSEVATQDVLFIGIGDWDSTGQSLYPTLSSSSLGITDAPDKNLAGVAYTAPLSGSLAETITYIHTTVKDTYTAYDKDSETSDGAYTKIGYDKTTSGTDGTTYSLFDFLKAPLSYFYADRNKYWYPSLSVEVNDKPIDLNSTMTYAPTSVSSNTTTVNGHSYKAFMNEIKTKLTPHDSTIYASENPTWTPDSNISIIDPEGNLVKISDMAKTSTSSNTTTYTYTDPKDKTTADLMDYQPNMLTVTSNVNPQKAGSYTVTYAFKDSQSNTTRASANVAVKDSNAAITGKDVTTSDPQNWNPIEGITSVTSSDGTTKLTQEQIAAAIRDGKITTTITDKDGKTVDSLTNAKSGAYSLTYNYTDDDNNTVMSQPVTLTVETPDQSSIAVQGSTIKNGGTWDLDNGITSVKKSDGTNMSSEEIKNAINNGNITATITGPNGATSINTTNPGDYKVIYTYKDDQGKSVTLDPITVTVSEPLVDNSSLTTKDTTLTTGSTWNPADNITTLVDPSGNNLVINQALENKVLTYTIQDSTETPIDSIDTSKAGIYIVTYSYTDSNGKTLTSKATVKIIDNPSSGNTSSGSSNGNSSTSNDSGNTSTDNTSSDNDNSNTITTDPGKPNNDNSNDSTGSSNVPNGSTATGSANTSASNNDSNNSVNTSSINNTSTSNAASASSPQIADNGSSQVTIPNNPINNSTTSETSDTKSTTLPQTGNQNNIWYSRLGVLLLTILATFGFKKKNNQ